MISIVLIEELESRSFDGRFMAPNTGCAVGNETRRRTLDIKRPKAPPSAKPIPPAMIDLVRHDSMPACI
jgi:hypothetical protein